MAIAPSTPDIGRLAFDLRIPVVGQHVDAVDGAARTGFVPASSLEAAGARASLINHSEHPVPLEAVQLGVAALRHVGLAAVVCAPDVASTPALLASRPAYLAIEPPALIGGDRAVSTAAPEVISDAATAVRRASPSTRLLCGAGVHDRRDVARALELGSEGVLVASAVTRAAVPADAIRELLRGF